MTAPPPTSADVRPIGRVAAVVVSPDGRVRLWSPGATELLGFSAREVIGRPARDLLAGAPGSAARGGARGPFGGRTVVLRHRSGRPVELWVHQLPLAESEGVLVLAFTTELVVSELVTNAIRHAGGPVGLRLIRDSLLVCEVSDSSNTQPRLRRACSTDEGGRGLFLVAQLTNRWGSRYGAFGKTIWAEQLIGSS